MKHLIFFLLLLSLVVPSHGQGNYSFEVRNNKYLVKDNRLYSLKGNRLKSHEYIRMRNIERNDFESKLLQTLLAYAVNQKKPVEVANDGEFYTIMIEYRHGYKSVNYMRVSDEAHVQSISSKINFEEIFREQCRRNFWDSREGKFIDLDSLFSHAEADYISEAKPVAAKGIKRILNFHDSLLTVYNAHYIQYLATDLNHSPDQQIDTAFNFYPLQNLRANTGFYLGIEINADQDYPKDSLDKAVEEYLQRVIDHTPKTTAQHLDRYQRFYRRFDFRTRSNESYCPIEIKGSLLVDLEKNPGINQFVIQSNDDNDYRTTNHFMHLLMKNNFADDTVRIEKYGDFMVALSKKSLYIIDPYSSKIVQFGERVREVMGHPFFATLLKSLSLENLQNLKPSISAAQILNEEVFVLKFDGDNYHRVVHKNELYHIKNFGLLDNKLEAIQLLNSKVDAKKLIELYVAHDLLFILNGTDLSLLNRDQLTYVAGNIRDLNESIISSEKHIYLFQQSTGVKINLLRFDKPSRKVAPVGYNLSRVDASPLVKAFLEYDGEQTNGLQMIDWELLDGQYLKAQYDAHYLLLTQIDGTVHTKKLVITTPVNELVKKKWYAHFQSQANTKPTWEILFTKDSIPFFYDQSTLHYVADAQFLLYDSIGLDAVVYNQNFLDELNTALGLDSVFMLNYTNYDPMSVVKYSKEGFYRIYTSHKPKAERQTSIRVTNLLEFSDDPVITTSLIEIIKKQHIRDTIAYSKIDFHQFLTSGHRALYYNPGNQTNPINVIANKRGLMGNNVEFLTESVVDKLNWKEENIKVEEARFFESDHFDKDSICHWHEEFSLYKFVGDTEYRVKSTPRVTILNDGVQPDAPGCPNVPTLTFKLYTENLDNSFTANTELLKWLTLQYQGNNTNIKIIQVEGVGEGFILYDESGFYLINGPNKVRFYFSNCPNVLTYYDNSWFHKELNSAYIDFTTFLFKHSEALRGDYYIIGSSPKGIIYYSDSMDLGCLEDQIFSEIAGQLFLLNEDGIQVLPLDKVNEGELAKLMTDFLKTGNAIF